MSRTRPPSSPATDSPLFWLIVFVGMALFMSVAVEPKFARRQERLDRMHESRLRSRSASDGGMVGGGETSAEEPPRPAQSWQPARRVTLRPLTSVLALLLLAGLATWHFTRRRAPIVAETAPPSEKQGAP